MTDQQPPEADEPEPMSTDEAADVVRNDPALTVATHQSTADDDDPDADDELRP